ncbi:MAG: YicC family protein [Betaproteobacteria bacterium]|nr:YicC family protein [Betaproteobacteria bacterium]
MIYSMTGYAVKSRDIDCGTLNLELKSVNSRFLDVHFRVYEDLRFIEPALREMIVARLGRGKIECRVNLLSTSQTNRQLLPNEELLAQLKTLDTYVRALLPEAPPLSVDQILRWPGMLGEEETNTAAITIEAQELAAEALDDLIACRAREGEKLAAMIQERIALMRVQVAEVAPHIPAAQAAFQEKLKQRLLDAIGSADDERIRQEIAVFALRTDIAEELTRLSTHLDEAERVLRIGGNIGKRLDFLMQELNREANTLGSKSVAREVSQTAVELKLLIEQMREQIQNIE